MVTEEKNENSDQAEESREELDDAVKLTDFKKKPDCSHPVRRSEVNRGGRWRMERPFQGISR